MLQLANFKKAECKLDKMNFLKFQKRIKYILKINIYDLSYRNFEFYIELNSKSLEFKHLKFSDLMLLNFINLILYFVAYTSMRARILRV